MSIFSFLKPYRLPMAVALLFMLTELIVELVHPLLMAKVIDEGIMQNDLVMVIKWGSIMIGMSLLAFVSGILNSFYASHVSQSYGYDVRRGLFSKIQSFSFSNLSQFPTSSLITRMTNDVTQTQNTIFMSLRIMLRAPLLVIGGVLMAFLVNAKLALVLMTVIPILLIFLMWMMKKGRVLFQAVQQKLDGVNSVMKENLSGMRIVKAFLRHDYEMNRFTKANEQLRGQTVRVLKVMEVTLPILLFVMNMSMLVVLWIGSFEVRSGNAQVGEIVAIINYAFRITSAFSIFSFIIMAFSRARASASRIQEVLETEVDLTDNMNDESFVVQGGQIVFEDVSFHYPGTDQSVLQNISFTAEQGETVAILGATGSGKSSLFQLIPRLYDATSGAVFIDGRNVADVRAQDLRKSIGFVPQEALLFTGTIKENLAWGKEDATDDDMVQAAKDAQIHETIQKLPRKYETKIGQRGVNLSGGQKQRLSIARALIRKPSILLLDDSTSALDLKTEAKLLKALKTYTCTTLIITQKVSTAREANRILLLEDGKLVNQGTHEELVETSTLYQKIVQSQFGKEGLKHAQRAK
ncbi:ABC transporter ATP-binding protein [Metabacillus iocasae]|uniref:ATP-binding cassette subfamily B protein n=1 Tax=Priestia iocasae TaxID=2291674 RepID=A0ABS2QXW7_9BACI|nr:ABC transporter ATP-binding protein [Metabacillus iocasae]MBM7704270.1 ATP-binding cassette subfamily B protein [Metabacillus iocasae]